MDVKRVFSVERRVLVGGDIPVVVKVQSVSGLEGVMFVLVAQANGKNVLVGVRDGG
jgi:hypothetical protein